MVTRVHREGMSPRGTLTHNGPASPWRDNVTGTQTCRETETNYPTITQGTVPTTRTQPHKEHGLT